MRTILAAAVIVVVFAGLGAIGAVMAQTSPCVEGGAVAAGNDELASDCETLLSMKTALRGSSGTLNWWTGRSLDRWDGVTVSGGRVTQLSLPSKGLDGVVPAAIGRVSALEVLDLSENDLSGVLPEELDDLTSLTKWRLGGNEFTGCVPSGFANVTDNDLSELGLSVCGGGTSPTPQPTPPNVTPTPESGDATFDFLRNANCTEERLREIYGEDFTDENPDPPVRVGYNSIGWASFFNTWWWNADRTKLVSCIAVLYDNADSAGFQRGFAELRRYGEGTTQDILFEKKLRGLPEIGWDYVAAWIEQGERRSEQDDGSFQDEIEVIKTAAVMWRSNFTVTIVESTEPDPDRAVQVHRPVSNLNSMASMIDDYIDDYMSETASTRGYDIIELTPRSGASVAGVESGSLLDSANDQ